MILTDADELRKALRLALEERDEARAEVERLRGVVERLQQHYAELVRISCLSVAERQREACAEAMRPILRSMLSRGQAADLCRATPLVTDTKADGGSP